MSEVTLHLRHFAIECEYDTYTIANARLWPRLSDEFRQLFQVVPSSLGSGPSRCYLYPPLGIQLRVG